MLVRLYAIYIAVVDLRWAKVQHRAGARVVADLQHVESTRAVGCLLRLLPPAERVQGLSAAHLHLKLNRRRLAVRQHEALVSD